MEHKSNCAVHHVKCNCGAIIYEWEVEITARATLTFEAEFADEPRMDMENWLKGISGENCLWDKLAVAGKHRHSRSNGTELVIDEITFKERPREE